MRTFALAACLLSSVGSFSPSWNASPIQRFRQQGHHPVRNSVASPSVESSSYSSDSDSQPQQIASPTRDTTASASKSSSRVAILVCPAQFCVPDDYQVLFDNLAEWHSETINSSSDSDDDSNTNRIPPTIGTTLVAPLPRTEWIKVAKQLPTRAFLEARLPVAETLSWYFEAMDSALSQIFAAEQGKDDVSLCIIGHSIGGWVARAYLGGLAGSTTAVQRLAMERCSSLITLGTPHLSSETALVDQTRGLLRAIEETPACCPHALAARGMEITCVCSSGLDGSFFTTNLEQLVAASSYLPLLGRLSDNSNNGAARGDGIVPLDLAFLGAPARRVIVDQCALTQAPVRHSHVIPTPWNLIDGYAPSISLPPDTYPSYISKGVIPQWAPFIR